jgi:aminopeptidase N
MDIARTPAMPDAAPPLIRREDYKPYPWRVPQVGLDFRLDLTKTRIRATLLVERNPDAEASPVLRLNGDELTPQEVIVDGQAVNSWSMDGDDLCVTLPGERHEVQIVTEIDPSANSKLMGLYASNGMLCTQCEAEGFRRIAFFPDRPDVLSTYTVRMEGPKDQFPVLLSNGNEVATGDGADGMHWAEWHDPWPKPSYLFALVAADLVWREQRGRTPGGTEQLLQV